jgi:hypothetical protein
VSETISLEIRVPDELYDCILNANRYLYVVFDIIKKSNVTKKSFDTTVENRIIKRQATVIKDEWLTILMRLDISPELLIKESEHYLMWRDYQENMTNLDCNEFDRLIDRGIKIQNYDSMLVNRHYFFDETEM